jgi:hypothetical protein
MLPPPPADDPGRRRQEPSEADQPHEGPLGVEPGEEPQHRRRSCWYCGSADLAQGLKLGLSTEVSAVGVDYKTNIVLGLAVTSVEPLRVALCKRCGTVVRLSVENPEREWS